MPGYTALNLKEEAEDQGPRFGADPKEFQIRFGRVPLNCEHCGVSYIMLGPNHRRPDGHRHKRQEEIYVLVSGSGRIKAEDDIIELKPFTAVRVPPETMRGFEAGPEGAEFIAIGAPNTGPGDGVTTMNWWQ